MEETTISLFTHVILLAQDLGDQEVWRKRVLVPFFYLTNSVFSAVVLNLFSTTPHFSNCPLFLSTSL